MWQFDVIGYEVVPTSNYSHNLCSRRMLFVVLMQMTPGVYSSLALIQTKERLTHPAAQQVYTDWTACVLRDRT